MTTFKGLLKKVTTLKGILTIFAIMFVMRLTWFGRAIMTKAGDLFKKGMGGF